MIQLGKFQDLYIVKKKEFGVYVNDQKDVTDGSILLPAKQVPSMALPQIVSGEVDVQDLDLIIQKKS